MSLRVNSGMVRAACGSRRWNEEDDTSGIQFLSWAQKRGSKVVTST